MTRPRTLRCRHFVAAVLALTMLQACSLPWHKPSGREFGVIDKARIGAPGGWDFIAVDAPHQRLFISRGDRVQVWDTQTRRVSAEIGGTPGIHGIALSQDLQLGFTSNGRSNSIGVFRLDDLSLIDTIDIPGLNPDALLYEPLYKRLYSFNGKSGDATVIDARRLKVLGTIPLGGKPEVAASDGAGHLFVNIEDTAEIVMIDEATNQVRARWPLASCEEPTGLAIDVAHRRLFSVCANRTMVVMDADSGRLVARLPIGAAPDGVAFDPELGLVFSANGEGSLTVVHEDDPERYAVLATVATQEKARTLSLDPQAHRIYLVSADFAHSPPAAPDRPPARPSMVADSFTVLVVGPR